jgi:hypothetical protein
MVNKRPTCKTSSFAVILILTVLAISISETQIVHAANTYIITASSDTHATINPSGNVPVTNGSSQTFTFTARSGYMINKVLVDGSIVNNTSLYTFTNIQANHTISVSTSIITYQITSTADAHSTIDPSGSITANYSSSQSFTYYANTGYVITSVIVDGTPVPISGNYIFSNILANHNIAVKTSITNFTITSSSDTHSTINPSGAIQVPYDTSQTFTYSAKAGYALSSVIVDGNPTSIIGYFTFSNVKANHVISVSALSLPPTPSPSPTPTASPSPTSNPTVTPAPTPTPIPSPTPAPTSSPTSLPTSDPTSPPTQATQQTNTTSTQTTTSTTHPSTVPTSTPTTTTPIPITKIPQSTLLVNHNIISQSDIYPAGAVAAAIIGVTVVIAIVLKRKQQTSEEKEDFPVFSADQLLSSQD